MTETTAPTGRLLAQSAGVLGLARGWGMVVQFAAFLVAARFLGPVDFGVYALVYLFCSFLLLAASMGWGEYAFTHESERNASLSMCLAAGLVGGILLAFGGAIVDWQIGLEGRVTFLSLLLGMFMPLRAKNSMQISLLISTHRARRVALAQIVSESVFFVAIVASLNLGLGLLSLGIARVAQEIVAIVVCRDSSSRIFGVWPRSGQIKPLLVFVSKIQLSAVASYAQENISTILISFFLGPLGTGLYRAGARFPGAVSEVISEPLKPISWMSVRAASNDKEQMRATVSMLLIASLSAGGAAFTGLALIADDLIYILLGPEWAQAALVIAWLAVRQFMLLPVTLLIPILVFSDDLNIAPKIAFISAGLSTISLIVFAPAGLVWAAAGQCLAAMGTVALVYWAINRAIGFRLTAIITVMLPVLTGCVAMLIAIIASDMALDALLPIEMADGARAMLRIVAAIPAGVLSYCAAILTVSPSIRSMLFGFLWGRYPGMVAQKGSVGSFRKRDVTPRE